MKVEFYRQLKFCAGLLLTLIVLPLINCVTGGGLSALGIQPRSLGGLWGIPFAPWIHHSWYHLFSNAIPLMFFVLLMLQQGWRLFWQASLGIILISGLAVWLLASAGSHAGASGLIFGYWTFLVAMAWFRKDIRSLLLAIAALVFYGGLLFGLFQFRPYISWASHFYGALAGLAMGWLLGRTKQSSPLN